MSSTERRELSFKSFDEVLTDARNLRDKGYAKLGEWNLTQVCGHCGNWMRYPIDGFPKPNVFVGMILWLMKVTVAKGKLRKVLESGSMPLSQPTMPESIPTTNEMNEADAVDQLEKMIDRFENHRGQWHASPLFGALDTDELTRLNLIHCSLHFSFLIPKE